MGTRSGPLLFIADLRPCKLHNTVTVTCQRVAGKWLAASEPLIASSSYAGERMSE